MNRPFPPLRERVPSCLETSVVSLNISKAQQRTLHALAQGGHIALIRDESGAILGAECITREGWRLSDCTFAVFRGLKRKRLIASQGGGPYRITRDGLVNLRAQLDNRTTVRGW
jgi:uncharacterized protein YjhX (UPF0386 family)